LIVGGAEVISNLNQEPNPLRFTLYVLMQRKQIIFLLVILVSFFAFDALAESRKLGLSAPLSGGGAGWGNDVRNILNFANEKLAGGKYSFVVEDDRCDLKTARTVAQKLIAIDKITEVFTVCGQVVMATAQTYHNAGVTVIASLATPSQISSLGILRTSMGDALAAKRLANFIGDRHKTVSVLTEENEYPISFLNDFSKSAKNISLQIDNLNYLPEQRDFQPQLLSMKKRGVQALFLNTQTEEALASLVKQLKIIGFAPALYGAYLPGSANFLKIAGNLAEGMIFVDFPNADEMLTPEGKALYQEYLTRYGPIQGWSFAFPSTFEAFRAVHLALSSNQRVEQYFKSTSFDGIFGKYSFDTYGDIVGPQHVLRLIKNGHAELYPSGNS
jgi:branched-chain amino acid transport system substrate-binding protein